MIGRLQGILLSHDEQGVLLDVGGVGYEVEVPASVLLQLPASGQPLVLHTHLSIREDAHLLFGFLAEQDRSLFRQLIKVNGVGPKMALGIMSAMESRQLVACVMRNDLTALVKLPGVGKKTAERLVIDLRDRLKQWELEYGNRDGSRDGNPGSPDNRGLSATMVSRNDAISETENALISLGYKPQEATRAVVQAVDQLEVRDQEVKTELLLRLALKALAKSTH